MLSLPALLFKDKTMNRPRLSIEIPEDKHQRLKTLLPHGTKKIVFNLIIDDLIEMMEKLGAGRVVGAFINRDISLKDITKLKDV
jgi:hypothetical protein